MNWIRGQRRNSPPLSPGQEQEIARTNEDVIQNFNQALQQGWEDVRIDPAEIARQMEQERIAIEEIVEFLDESTSAGDREQSGALHSENDRESSGPLTLRPQEISMKSPESINLFQPEPDKPFVATPAALETFSIEVILQCFHHLQIQAILHEGLDYLQVFEDPKTEKRLWFIEGGDSICALLPSDY